MDQVFEIQSGAHSYAVVGQESFVGIFEAPRFQPRIDAALQARAGLFLLICGTIFAALSGTAGEFIGNWPFQSVLSLRSVAISILAGVASGLLAATFGVSEWTKWQRPRVWARCFFDWLERFTFIPAKGHIIDRSVATTVRSGDLGPVPSPAVTR